VRLLVVWLGEEELGELDWDTDAGVSLVARSRTPGSIPRRQQCLGHITVGRYVIDAFLLDVVTK
jgi:hypothetical protein